MKRRKIIYDEHPCIICLKYTTNKNYCDFHEKLYTKTKQYKPRQKISISAESESVSLFNRHETVNKLF